MKLKRILCVLLTIMMLSLSAVCTAAAKETEAEIGMEPAIVATTTDIETTEEPIAALNLDNPCEVDENGDVVLEKGKLIDLILPEMLDGQKLTSISDWSFTECPYIRSVVIPETILEIGENAFADCEFLDTIYVIGHDEDDLTLGDNWNSDADVMYVVHVAEEAALEAISISKAPNKVDYLVGDAFDATGMEVTAAYEDGSTRVIDDYVIKGEQDLTAETTSVKISYTEENVTKSCTVNITVTDEENAETESDVKAAVSKNPADGQDNAESSTESSEQVTALDQTTEEDSRGEEESPAVSEEAGVSDQTENDDSRKNITTDENNASSQSEDDNEPAGTPGEAAPQSSEGVNTEGDDNVERNAKDEATE